MSKYEEDFEDIIGRKSSAYLIDNRMGTVCLQWWQVDASSSTFGSTFSLSDVSSDEADFGDGDVARGWPLSNEANELLTEAFDPRDEEDSERALLPPLDGSSSEELMVLGAFGSRNEAEECIQIQWMNGRKK